MSNYPDDFSGLPEEQLTPAQECAGATIQAIEQFRKEATSAAVEAVALALVKYDLEVEIDEIHEGILEAMNEETAEQYNNAIDIFEGNE